VGFGVGLGDGGGLEEGTVNICFLFSRMSFAFSLAVIVVVVVVAEVVTVVVGAFEGSGGVGGLGGVGG